MQTTGGLTFQGGLYIFANAGGGGGGSGETLIFLDPGNPSSYPGTGTTVTSIGTSSVSGTMSGVTYDSGTAGGVFDFDGSAGISFDPYDFGTAITVAAWVYPRDNFSINTIMANGAAGLSGNGFKIEWNNWNTSDLKMLVEAGNGSSGSTVESTTAQVVNDQWQHLVYTIDTSTQTATLYRNGSSVPTTGSLVANIAMTNAWYVGRFPEDAYNMDAKMGEFKVFAGVLDAGAVLTEYNATKSRYGL